MDALVHFNPQGPRGPRHNCWPRHSGYNNFNPQGPRGPRQRLELHVSLERLFQSTRPSRASTGLRNWYSRQARFQSTRPSRASTRMTRCTLTKILISIHKALAGLDSKTIQQSLHIPLTFYALCPPPSLFQPPPSIHPAYFHGFSSVFQVRISRTFHVSLAFAPGLMGFRLTEITLYLYTT